MQREAYVILSPACFGPEWKADAHLFKLLS